MATARLSLAMDEPRSRTERDLLVMFRESTQNDQTMLFGVLQMWPSLSTAHRGLVFRIADALYSAAKWRHHLPVPPEPAPESERRARLMADETNVLRKNIGTIDGDDRPGE